MFKKITRLFLVLFAVSLTSFAYAQQIHNIDFEPNGIGADWDWTVAENSDNPPLEFVSNPAKNGINVSATSAKFIARASGNPWALFFTADDGEFTFDANNSIIKMMVYKPNLSTVTFKVEGGTGTPTEVKAVNTVTNEWEELTFDFSSLIGSTFSRLVIIPDHDARTAEHVLYLDNIKVPDGVINELPAPKVHAPIPDDPAASVISIYSDAYTSLEGTDFYPNWGQSTVVTQTTIEEDNTLLYEFLNYQGTQLAAAQDLTNMKSMHIDFWTPNSTALSVFLISKESGEKQYDFVIKKEEWVSVDIPLSIFTAQGLALKDIHQLKIVGNGTLYFDNIYFTKESTQAPKPTVHAPTPTDPAANVISIYSDAYTSLAGTDFYPNWGQATIVSQVKIEEDNTLLYENLNYQGTQFAEAQDLTKMMYMHVDFWTASSNSFAISLISQKSGEQKYSFEITPNTWNSIDIPLSHFTGLGLDLKDIHQLKFDGNGTIYLDNIYFKKEPSSVEEADNVNSLFILEQNYPNPFSNNTQIRFTLLESNHVVLKVYDSFGNKVETLADTFISDGYHEFGFNAAGLSSGTYFISMTAGKITSTRAITIIK